MGAQIGRRSWRRRHGRLACVLPVAIAALCLGLAGTSPPAIAAVTAGSSFVTASGNQLELNGKGWRFTGYNDFRLPSLTLGTQYNCGGLYTPTWLGQQLDEIKNASQSSVIRTWFFESYSGDNWVQLDAVVNAAAARGIKVVPVLVNEWGDCEAYPNGVAAYKGLSWYQGGYKQANDGYPVSFRDYAVAIAQHYAGNPTIAFWQLVNEAQANSSDGTCDEAAAAAAIRSFGDDVTGAIKAVDPSHLVSLGTIGQGQCGLQGSDYRYVHAGAVDLCEAHWYGGPDLTSALSDAAMCNALGKPSFIGEDGIDASVQPNWTSTGVVTPQSLQQRATFFSHEMSATFNAGYSGFLIWEHSLTSDSYGVGPGDPTEQLMSTWQQCNDSGYTASGQACPNAASEAVAEGANGATLALNSIQSQTYVAAGYSSVGGSTNDTPALATTPGASPVNYYLATQADHSVQMRTDTRGWTTVSPAGSCYSGPSAVITGTSTLMLNVACVSAALRPQIASVQFLAGSLPNLVAWRSLGGSTAAAPALFTSANASQVLWIAVVGTDTRLWLRPVATTGSWTGLGGACIGHPGAGTGGGVTYVGCHGCDGSLWYATTTGRSWSSLHSAAGALVGGIGIVSHGNTATAYAEQTDGSAWHVALNQSGTNDGWVSDQQRVQNGVGDAVAEGIDGAVWALNATQTRSVLVPAYVSLGGSTTDTPAVVGVAAAGGPDIVYYLATQADHSVQMRTGSGAWATVSPAGTCYSGPSALVTGSVGATTLVVACNDGTQSPQYASVPIIAGALPSLTGWTSVGGLSDFAPALFSSISGQPWIVVVGTDNALWMRPLTSVGAWLPLGGSCIGHPGASTGGGVTYVGCQGSDHALWYATSTGIGWSAFQYGGGSLMGGIGIVSNGATAAVYGEQSDGKAWHTVINQSGATSGWVSDGQAVQNGAGGAGI